MGYEIPTARDARSNNEILTALALRLNITLFYLRAKSLTVLEPPAAARMVAAPGGEGGGLRHQMKPTTKMLSTISSGGSGRPYKKRLSHRYTGRRSEKEKKKKALS